jgi:hypothetical protein
MFTRGRVAAFALAVLALVGAALFVVRTRADLNTARDGLTRSGANLTRLDAQLHAAVADRADAFTKLEGVRDGLRRETASRDALRETDRVRYADLVATLATLTQHRTELTADSARARLLDDCLVGASQVLNEAAVGDTNRLSSTLPSVQRRCAAAAA